MTRRLCIILVSLLVFFTTKTCFAAVQITPVQLNLGLTETYTFSAPPGSYIAGFAFSEDSDYGTYGSIWVQYQNMASRFFWTNASYSETNQNGGAWIKFYPDGNRGYWIGSLTVYVGTNVADQQTIEQARDAALSANISAQQANTNASYSANRSWYNGGYGGSPESVANLAGYIRNTQLPGIDTKISNLQTAVTNINNSIGNDTVAPNIKVRTVSGARATSAGSINIVISGADNKDSFTTLQYSVNGGAYAPMPANGIVNIPVNVSPITTTTIAVKDSAGNITTELISIRKL